MVDILLLENRVLNTIQLGESHFREFKSVLEGKPDNKKPILVKHICQKIAEELIAFANADGGELLIGVEDDGSITGIPHSEDEIDTMLNAPYTHVHAETKLPLLHVAKLKIHDKWILFFHVAKGTSEIYQLPDGRCLRRRDKERIPATFSTITFDRQEKKSRQYDQEFVDGASVSDLNINLLRAIADNYLPGLSIELYLQQAGLADYGPNGLYLRQAALLLFAKDIQRWHPRSQVRILRIIGTELKSGESYNVKSDEFISGNIFELVQNSWDRLRPFLADKTEFGSDAKFEQKYIYPEAACREALINAIAHRDYSIMNAIEVFIFDDRMEIRNPGALLSTITLKDLEELQNAHESRNSLVAKVLRENQHMRELGEGIRRIFNLMNQNELQSPKLYSNRTSFSITLYHKTIFSEQQRIWLQQFEAFNLSSLQKKIIALGMGGREISPSDIEKAINTKDRTIYDVEVTGLRQSGILHEVRKAPAAKQMARQKSIHHRAIGRFVVHLPNLLLPNDKITNKVIVNGIPENIEVIELKQLFLPYGNLEVETLAYDKYKEGFLYAILVFESSEGAISALKAPHYLNNRPLKVAPYSPKKRKPE